MRVIFILNHIQAQPALVLFEDMSLFTGASGQTKGQMKTFLDCIAFSLPSDQWGSSLSLLCTTPGVNCFS